MPRKRKKRNGGRTRIYDDCIPCTVTADAMTRRCIEAFGIGNRSLGVRRLAHVAKVLHQMLEADPEGNAELEHELDAVLGGPGQLRAALEAAFASIRDVE